MREIAVIATEKEYAEYLKNNLEKYLNAYATFKAYSTCEIDYFKDVKENFIVTSAFNVFEKVRPYVTNDKEILVLSFALGKKQMELLKDIPRGSKVLLVNFDYRSCMHTITSMYNAGLRDFELFPYYGDGEYDKSIEIAITPNEEHLVPPGMKRIINVGESYVDINALYLIADKLGVGASFASNEAFKARQDYYYINSSMDRLLYEHEQMNDKLGTLIQLMNEGILIIDNEHQIYLSNEKAKKLLGAEKFDLNGVKIQEILPGIDVKDEDENLLKYKHGNIIASSTPIVTEGKTIGHIITLSRFEDVEEKQHILRSKLSNISHKAKYTFNDIVGDSEKLRRNIEYAKRIAKNDSAILITGQSGTGKEVFAQSIHNESDRKKYNFVAVNCAAIPDNLLESEMFGYEEGAFTGARKGGKIGYFEIAHKGTIFLDEIGEMPLQLQSKLLRVLEEKRVTRVGSNKEVDVDVRVIAATNKNLFEMVETGAFREDLYYRINVLPLQIEGLSERKADIFPLVYEFMNKMGKSFAFSEDAKKAMYEHPWKGNVRELRNVVEFFCSQNRELIEMENFPPNWEGMSRKRSEAPNTSEESTTELFLIQNGKNLYLFKDVLSVLNSSYEQGKKIGRYNLLKDLQEQRKDISEGEVRFALKKLADYGYIDVGRGRSGSRITSSGKNLFNKLNECKIGFIGK